MFTFIAITHPVLHFKAWVFVSLNYNRKNLQTGVERVSLTLGKSSNYRITHFNNTRLQTDSLSVQLTSMLVPRDILHFVSARISLSSSDVHEPHDEHVKV